MQPEKRSFTAWSMSEGDIQLPSWPGTPDLVVGIVSDRFSVQINVRDSIRATSAGLVRASQLEIIFFLF